MRQEHKEKIYNECSSYLVAFEHFTCAALIITKDLTLLDYNQSAARLFFEGVGFAQNSDKTLPHTLEWIRGSLADIPDDLPYECTHLITQEQKELLFNIKIKGLKDRQKETFGYVVLLNDISEVELAKEKYKDAQEIMIAQSRHAAIGEMIAMIAHHWRQPLGIISMSANNLLVDVQLGEIDPQTLQQHLEEILAQSEYLSNTINDFSNFFKPKKEKQSVRPIEILKEAYQILASDLLEGGIEVSITDNSTQEINLHAKELLQVVLNLLTNSDEAFAKREQPYKKISLSVEDKENSVLLRLCDNAGGIAEEIKERVFDPYISSKETLIGTGLGLYVSKIIVQKHLQGKIWFENRDGGVCFNIELPTTHKEKS